MGSGCRGEPDEERRVDRGSIGRSMTEDDDDGSDIERSCGRKEDQTIGLVREEEAEVEVDEGVVRSRMSIRAIFPSELAKKRRLESCGERRTREEGSSVLGEGDMDDERDKNEDKSTVAVHDDVERSHSFITE